MLDLFKLHVLLERRLTEGLPTPTYYALYCIAAANVSPERIVVHNQNVARMARHPAGARQS